VRCRLTVVWKSFARLVLYECTFTFKQKILEKYNDIEHRPNLYTCTSETDFVNTPCSKSKPLDV